MERTGGKRNEATRDETTLQNQAITKEKERVMP